MLTTKGIGNDFGNDLPWVVVMRGEIRNFGLESKSSVITFTLSEGMIRCDSYSVFSENTF